MKKKLLSTCALLAFATTSNFVSAAATEDNWYITGNVGGFLAKNLGEDSKDKKTGDETKDKVVMKSKIGILGFLGGGYKINENLRADLTFFFAKPRYENFSEDRELEAARQTGDYANVRKIKHDIGIDVKAYGLMVTGYVSFPVSDFAEIYIGPSIGYSRVAASISRKTEPIKETPATQQPAAQQPAAQQPAAPPPAAQQPAAPPPAANTETTEPKGDLIGQNNFAWGISAGIGFNMEDVGKIDLQYRYINFGKIGNKFKDENLKDEKIKPEDIRGHVFTIGIRKEF